MLNNFSVGMSQCYMQKNKNQYKIRENQVLEVHLEKKNIKLSYNLRSQALKY